MARWDQSTRDRDIGLNRMPRRLARGDAAYVLGGGVLSARAEASSELILLDTPV
jgi:hypothetical protein